MTCTLALLGVLASCSAPELPGRRSGTRVLVIGLDGADWERIDPLVEQGRLPHLADLASRGATARLRGGRPRLAPPAWTTLATARPPDQHHVLGGFEVDEAGRIAPIAGRARAVKALWNLADDGGLTSAVVGWPATWPAEEIGGAMVADRWAPAALATPPLPAEAGTVSPPDLARAIEATRVDPRWMSAAQMRRFLPHSGEISDPAGGAGFGVGVNADLDLRLRNIVASTRSLEEAAELLLRGLAPDLLMVEFAGLAEVGRLFARHEFPPRPGTDPDEARVYGGIVDDFLRYQDEVVGRLVEAAGEETAVVIVSPHGIMRGVDRPLHPPADQEWIEDPWRTDTGLLVLAGGPFLAVRLAEVRLADVTPTILAVLGLPVAEDFEGVPIRAALKPQFQAAHPVHVVASYERLGKRVRRLEGASGMAPGDDTVADALTASALPPPEEVEGSVRAAARLNAARVLADAGRTWEAAAALREAIALDPSLIPAHRELFDMLVREDRPEEALAAGRDLLALAPEADAYVAVASFCARSGRVREGLELFGAAGPGVGEGPLLARGILEEAGGDPVVAESLYREALAVEPGSWAAAEALLRLLEMGGRIDAALPHLRRGLAHHEGNSVPHLAALGYIALERGDLAAAGEYLARAEELAPGDPGVEMYLGALHFKTGGFSRAALAYERVLEADPGNADARRNHILALGRLGRVAQALSVYRDAGPEGRGDPHLLTAAAHACLLNGMPAEGLPLAEEALRLDAASDEARQLVASLRRAVAAPPAPE
jgi:tetratricopeptide (TPR) repeat protein